MAKRRDYQPAHYAGITKAHFGLRRMNIHIDKIHRQINIERNNGITVAREEILIGPAYRAVQKLIFNRTPIDKEILMLRVPPRESRKARKAR